MVGKIQPPPCSTRSWRIEFCLLPWIMLKLLTLLTPPERYLPTRKVAVSVLMAANIWSAVGTWGHGRYFLKEFEAIIFSYKAISLLFFASSSIAWNKYSPFWGALPQKEKLIMKPRNQESIMKPTYYASRLNYKSIVPSRKQSQGLFIVVFLSLLHLQMYKEGNRVRGKETGTFLAPN